MFVHVYYTKNATVISPAFGMSVKLAPTHYVSKTIFISTTC